LQFRPAEPTNLAEVLGLQAEKLIEIGVPAEVKVVVDKYRNDLMAAIKAFEWKLELVEIGLINVAICDFRARASFLCEVANIPVDRRYTDPDKCTNFEGIVTPEGIAIVHAQFGKKYANHAPCNVRTIHDPTETLGTLTVGLHGLIYEPTLLNEIYMDLPGSVSARGYVPFLNLSVDELYLNARYGVAALPNYGSVSFGS
jgi:hypothetical protein